MHVGRWRNVAPLAQQLADRLNNQGLGPCQVQATVEPSGLPVDIQFGTNRAILVCCSTDFAVQYEPNEMDKEKCSFGQIESALRDQEGSFDPGKISGKLTRTMQHHIGLLKKAGMPPLLVPWWAV